MKKTLAAAAACSIVLSMGCGPSEPAVCPDAAKLTLDENASRLNLTAAIINAPLACQDQDTSDSLNLSYSIQGQPIESGFGYNFVSSSITWNGSVLPVTVRATFTLTDLEFPNNNINDVEDWSALSRDEVSACAVYMKSVVTRECDSYEPTPFTVSADNSDFSETVAGWEQSITYTTSHPFHVGSADGLGGGDNTVTPEECAAFFQWQDSDNAFVDGQCSVIFTDSGNATAIGGVATNFTVTFVTDFDIGSDHVLVSGVFTNAENGDTAVSSVHPITLFYLTTNNAGFTTATAGTPQQFIVYTAHAFDVAAAGGIGGGDGTVTNAECEAFFTWLSGVNAFTQSGCSVIFEESGTNIALNNQSKAFTVSFQTTGDTELEQVLLIGVFTSAVSSHTATGSVIPST